MYQLPELLTKVVTIKLNTGYELLTKLMGVDEESGLITVEHPKIVTIIDAGISLMPFTFTSDSSIVVLPLNSILTILESSDAAVIDYTNLVEEINKNKDQEETSSSS